VTLFLRPRPGHLDYLGINASNKQANVIGEWRFWLVLVCRYILLACQEYPVVEKKIDVMSKKAKCDPNSTIVKTLTYFKAVLPS